jgi:16S rRNA (adenine1518-N6/adenine1519-N6)-dimethyltransferase
MSGPGLPYAGHWCRYRTGRGPIAFPQNQSELRRVLREWGIRPRRRFGQNFLVDPNAMDALISDAGLREGDVILEVGPGPGALTARLLEAGARVMAVEIDEKLAALLVHLMEEHPALTLLVADILEAKHRLNPEVLAHLDEMRHGGPWRVVANLPYQVASPFTADLLGLPEPPKDILVTVQAEVADRMLAQPGTSEYGPLAVVLSLAARVERCRDLAPEVFWPRPKVRSAIVRITPDPIRRARWGDWSRIEAFVRDVFHHRRKTLRQGLIKAGWPAERVSGGLDRLGMDGSVRAEALSPERLVEIGQELGEKGIPARSRRGQGRRTRGKFPDA